MTILTTCVLHPPCRSLRRALHLESKSCPMMKHLHLDSTIRTMILLQVQHKSGQDQNQNHATHLAPAHHRPIPISSQDQQVKTRHRKANFPRSAFTMCLLLHLHNSIWRVRLRRRDERKENCSNQVLAVPVYHPQQVAGTMPHQMNVSVDLHLRCRLPVECALLRPQDLRSPYRT